MRIPEEDLGPRWLRDYGNIEADIARMEEFAAKLAAEVRDNYATHLPYVSESMTVALPAVPAGFPELHGFLQTHNEAQVATHGNVYTYRDATGGFANAAGSISAKYRGSDAFAAARVSDVEKALAAHTPGVARPTGTTSTSDAYSDGGDN